jgi:parallel beta-helix repeat protein
MREAAMGMNRTLGWVLVLAFSVSLAALGGGTRGPIAILGDGDFTAANGVVGGSGTRDDPYIIAGWEIDVPQGVPYGVKVESASSSFVLRGLVIRGAASSDGAAIRLGFVSAARMEGCSISSSTNGVELASSTDVILERNVLVISGRGLVITGESAAEYRHAIDESNVLNDYPIRYLYGRDGETVSGVKTGNLFVAASRNMTITDNEVICGDGIQLAFVETSAVTANRVRRASPVPVESGITLYRSSGNTVSGNLIWNNRRAGIYLWLSSGNVLTGNELDANDTGILLAASDQNEISGNVLSFNPTGIDLSAGSTGNVLMKNVFQDEKGKYRVKYGVTIEAATGNRVESNAIVNAETGVFLGSSASGNVVLSNTIAGAAYGLSLTGSNNEVAGNLITSCGRGILFVETYGRETPSGNRIHDNTLSENRHQIYLSRDSQGNQLYRNAILGEATAVGSDGKLVSSNVLDYGQNVWTVAGDGNYWAGYTGGDADGNGIGDLPVLVVPAGAQDTAPFLAPPSGRTALGVLGTLDMETVTVRTASGDRVEFAALIADETYARFTGFRGFPASFLPGFPAILFVFDQEVSARFTMESVPFALDIAFFAASGAYAGGTTMEASSTKLYTSSGPFLYALELPDGTLAARGIGPDSTFAR